MESKYIYCLISAENMDQANKILDTLLEKKLVTGGQIIQSPSKFLWQGKVMEMEYCTITSFSLKIHEQKIIEIVEGISIEEVPMITFLPMDGNEKLLTWIEETVA